MQKLEKSILDTLIYFDIFDYPLILSEFYQWLFQSKSNLSDIESVFEQSGFLKEKIEQKNNFFLNYEMGSSEPLLGEMAKIGAEAPIYPDNSIHKIKSHNSKNFYFLKGREKIIKIRKDRKETDAKKIKKAFRISKFLSLIPFIKGIAVCNNLGYSNAPEESDIDLFIITLKNRIWMARFLIILPLKLFGLRPSGKNKKDKICVHFFVTEDNLNLENILLKEKEGIPDIHFIYWLTQFLPLYGEDNIWQKFYEANKWLKNFLPNFEFKSEFPQIEQPIFPRKIKKIIQFIHNHFLKGFPENIFKWLQLKIMPENLIELSKEGRDVIIGDKILKLHQKDKREFYRQKFIKNRLLTEKL